jgi:hypothetical protein
MAWAAAFAAAFLDSLAAAFAAISADMRHLKKKKRKPHSTRWVVVSSRTPTRNEGLAAFSEKNADTAWALSGLSALKAA